MAVRTSAAARRRRKRSGSSFRRIQKRSCPKLTHPSTMGEPTSVTATAANASPLANATRSESKGSALNPAASAIDSRKTVGT